MSSFRRIFVWNCSKRSMTIIIIIYFFSKKSSSLLFHSIQEKNWAVVSLLSYPLQLMSPLQDFNLFKLPFYCTPICLLRSTLTDSGTDGKAIRECKRWSILRTWPSHAHLFLASCLLIGSIPARTVIASFVGASLVLASTLLVSDKGYLRTI